MSSPKKKMGQAKYSKKNIPYRYSPKPSPSHLLCGIYAETLPVAFPNINNKNAQNGIHPCPNRYRNTYSSSQPLSYEFLKDPPASP